MNCARSPPHANKHAYVKINQMQSFLSSVSKQQPQGQSKLTEKTFREIVAGNSELRRRWLPVLQDVLLCKLDEAEGRCRRTRKGPFEEDRCAVKLTSKRPFAAFVAKTETSTVEHAGRSLVLNFLKLYAAAAKALLFPHWGEAVWWSWSRLFDEQCDVASVERCAMDMTRHLFGGHVSLSKWISDGLLADNHGEWTLLKYLGGGESNKSCATKTANRRQAINKQRCRNAWQKASSLSLCIGPKSYGSHRRRRRNTVVTK